MYILDVIRTEGDRMQEQVDNLTPFTVPGTDGKVKVSFRCAPTLIDGKVRKVWSDVTSAFTNCPLCGATPRQMGKPRGVEHDFTPSPEALKYSCCGLHGPLRSFDWFTKNRFHWDIKSWTCV